MTARGASAGQTGRVDSLAATVASDPSLRDAADVAAELGVDPAVGLTSAEAARRLREDGPNELRAKPPVPLWRKILAQFQHPLIYLLLGAVAISLIVWAAEGAVGVPIDATVITAVVILNAALGLVQESRAETAVAALKSMTEASSTVLRDAGWTVLRGGPGTDLPVLWQEAHERTTEAMRS